MKKIFLYVQIGHDENVNSLIKGMIPIALEEIRERLSGVNEKQKFEFFSLWDGINCTWASWSHQISVEISNLLSDIFERRSFTSNHLADQKFLINFDKDHTLVIAHRQSSDWQDEEKFKFTFYKQKC